MLRRKILDTNSFYEDSLHWFCLSIYEWVVADAVWGVQLKFNTRGAVTAPVWIRSLLINGLRTCLSQTFLIEENKMGETWSSCREAAPLTSETCDQLWVIRMARYGAEHKWVKCPRWGGQGGGVNVTKPVGLCLCGSESNCSVATSPIVSLGQNVRREGRLQGSESETRRSLKSRIER